MDICRYFLCFTLFSFIGWAYESLYYSIQQKRLVNSGFLTGCICPIYGIGGLMLSLLSGRVENPIALFAIGMLVTSALEYFVSWLMEMLFHKRWWNYTNWPLNINGRVCIIAGAAFGIMSVVGVLQIIPGTFTFMNGLSGRTVHIAAAVIGLIMTADMALTIKNSEKFNDKLWYVREQAKIFEDDGIGSRLMTAIDERFVRVHPIRTINRLRSNRPEREGIIEKIKRYFNR